LREKLATFLLQPKPSWAKLLLCTVSGCMIFLATATFDIWPLAWVSFVPLLFAIQGIATTRRAFFWGWFAGLVTNAGGFYWINLLLVRFGHFPQYASIPLYLLLMAYQGLHFGLFAYLVTRTRDTYPRLPMVVLAPVFWVSCELLMPFIFDWYMAITQAWNPLVIQVADLAGPLGVSFVLLVGSGVAFDVVAAWLKGECLPWKSSVAGLALIALALGYGALRIHQVDNDRVAAPKLKIGTVQGNVGIVEKGAAALAPSHHEMHLQISKELQDQGAELLVWPESSYPYAINRERKTDWPDHDIRKVMRGIKVPLIFGALTYSRKENYPYNTAYIMQPDGKITGSYDKNYLLVFGEYIPFYEKVPNFRKWLPEASHFAHGTEVTTFDYKGHKIAPLICYEDILPAFTRRLSKLEPNLMVNITNDAWFGQTSEPYEHLALAVFRSVELRLDMVRAVNTGVSAIIDSAGRVVIQTQSYDPVITPGVPAQGMLGEVALQKPGKTVYGMVGDLFGYLNLGLTLLMMALLWRNSRRNGNVSRREKKRK